MSPLIIGASALVALAVALVTFGVYSLVTSESGRIASRVGRSGRNRNAAPTSASVPMRGEGGNRAFSTLDQPLQRLAWAETTRRALQRADINLLVVEFVALRVAAAAIAAILVFFFVGGLPGVLGAPIAAIVGWVLPVFWVRQRAEKRQRALEAQLDGALVNIASALKAGFSFLQACQITLPQLQWPLKDDLEEALEETQLGSTIEDAFAGLATKIRSYEFDIVVNAVMIQRSVGGNLADILERVAKTIRERRELKGHIMALTAQQRLSAIFVAAVPGLMAGFLSLTSPEFMHPLWHTTIGLILVGVGMVLDGFGFVVMRKLTKIDF